MTWDGHDELGLEEVAGVLQLYASQAPPARPDLATRVMASVGDARAIGRPTPAAERRPSVLMRLGFALRPVQVRSLLAAAALAALVGIGAVAASGGALPFQLPTVGGPGAPNPSRHVPPSIELDGDAPAGPNATAPGDEDAVEAPGSRDGDEADEVDEADGQDEPEDEASEQDDESATDDPDEEGAADADDDDASETEHPSESHWADGGSDDGRSDEESGSPGGSPQTEDAREDD